jgi:DNA-binding NarL/FixJ family response regulator
MRVLTADDHGLFRDGLRLVLDQLEEGIEILEAGSLPAALDAAQGLNDLDLALLDLNMPGMEGIAGVRRFRKMYPDVPIVVISGSDNLLDIDQAMAAGVAGFICKTSSSQVMLSALRLVLAGGVYLPSELLQRHPGNSAARYSSAGNNPEINLTGRQIEVLRLLAEGKPNKVIAAELELSEGTVKIHLNAIFRALKVRNRTEAVLAAQQLGLSVSD